MFALLAAIRVFFCSRADLALEILALRQQLAVLNHDRLPTARGTFPVGPLFVNLPGLGPPSVLASRLPGTCLRPRLLAHFTARRFGKLRAASLFFKRMRQCDSIRQRSGVSRCIEQTGPASRLGNCCSIQRNPVG